MRLNFQQQKPINLSAGGPSFVPDQSREADQEANIRLQMINEQQQALKDMAQAAVIVNKALHDAEIQDENNDLQELSNQMDNIIDNNYFEFQQSNKGVSSVKGELESLGAELESFHKEDSAKRSNRFQKKRQLLAQGKIGDARKNYMQTGIQNTKTNVLKSLIDKEHELMNSDKSLDLKINEYDAFAENTRTTLGVDVDRYKDQVRKRLIRQRVMTELVTMDDQKRRNAYAFMEEQAKNPTLGVPSLYFLELSRQVRGEAFFFEKDTVLTVLDQTVQSISQKELVGFINKYGSYTTEVNNRTGKQTSSVKIDDAKWEEVQDKFPHITKKTFFAYLQKAAAQYDKLNNSILGKISYSDVKSEFENRNDIYFKYITEQYKINDDGNLIVNKSVNPVGKPWEEEIFLQVKNDPIYLEEKDNAIRLDAIVENINEALQLEPKKENINAINDIYLATKKEVKEIDGKSRYFRYADWFIEQKGREVKRLLERINNGQKDFDALVRLESPIRPPTINTYRKIRRSKSPYMKLND